MKNNCRDPLLLAVIAVVEFLKWLVGRNRK
jgi:hypothetical protein